MAKFEIGDRVEFKTDYYGYAELDEGVGTVLEDVSCESKDCCAIGMYTVKVHGHDDELGIYEEQELTKID